MPRNGSGVYSLPGGYLATTGQAATSAQHNTPLEDVATALTDSLPRAGTAAMTGALAMGANKITGLADATLATDAMNRQAADARYLLSAGNGVDSDDYTDGSIDLEHLSAAIQSLLHNTGDIKKIAGSTVPSGWLLCYGQAISRTTYADLFAEIGTTYGAGDGSTTFNVPDNRGRADVGKDNMGGVSANRLTNQSGGLNGDTLGATGGSETHTLTESQMPLHGHPFRISNDSTGAGYTGGFTTRTTGAVTRSAFTGTPSSTDGEQIGGTGGGAAHNNVQPSIVFNVIIKT